MGDFPQVTQSFDLVMSQEKADKIKKSMAKLSLKKPVWAEKMPEDVWLTKMFSDTKMFS